MKYILILITSIYITTSSIQADIIMGVVPQQSPLKLLKVWSPIAKYLTEQMGEKVVFRTEKSINKFEEVLYSGGYDFAYMNPYHYVVANKKQGYMAHVRSTKDIRGILVMKAGESIDNIKGRDNRYLFPSPNAFAATLLTKYDLVQIYGVSLDSLEKVLYVNSHDSVYKGISRGVGNIGGGIERTYNNLDDLETKKHINIVHITKAYPSHPFGFKPSMPDQNKIKLTDALLNIPKHLLKALSIKELKKIDNEEYSSVRELAIKLKIMPE